MSKEVVKYKNDMNKLNFKGLGKSDMNLFLAICSKVKEQGENEISIEFDYLRQISHYTGHTIDGFINNLKRMSQRIMAVNCEIIMDNGGFDMFHLFNRFTANPETQILTVKVNSDFTWLLNEFTNNYTIFDLKEFVRLQSKYAKNLYRLLKQWRNTGQYIFNDINQFRELMDVPKSYNSKRLCEKIIMPAVKEISKLNKSFINFQCEPLYAKRRGKPLTGYKFTWKPEERVQPAIQPTFEQQKKNVAKKTLKPPEKKKSTNKFCNFEQHHYSKEDMEQIERALLQNSEKIIQEHKEYQV